MQLSLHLVFKGQCEAAFQFYERALGGRIVTMLRYGDSPMADQVAAEWRGKIVHASLTIGGQLLAGADVLPEQYERPQGFFVLLSPKDPVETERLFYALAQNGEVRMALQKTFWSPAFGMVVDQFGVPWELSCEQR
jgi:PhnB protein